MFDLFRKITNLFFGLGIGRRFPRLRAIHGSLYRKFLPKGIVLRHIQGSKMFIDTADTGVAPYLLMRGVYGEYETDVIRSMVKPGMIAVDIGANVGYFTLILAKLVGGGGKVYAFEPDYQSFSILERNVAINNLSNVALSCQALGPGSGKTFLFKDQYNLGNSSVSPGNIDNPAGKTEVGVVSLDDYLGSGRVDFIKLDVQGAEGQVISGAKSVLARSDNIAMLMEFWPFGLRNAGTDPYLLARELASMGFSFSILDVQKRRLFSVELENIRSVENRRPEGKGSAYLLCRKA